MQWWFRILQYRLPGREGGATTPASALVLSWLPPPVLALAGLLWRTTAGSSPADGLPVGVGGVVRGGGFALAVHALARDARALDFFRLHDGRLAEPRDEIAHRGV